MHLAEQAAHRVLGQVRLAGRCRLLSDERGHGLGQAAQRAVAGVVDVPCKRPPRFGQGSAQRLQAGRSVRVVGAGDGAQAGQGTGGARLDAGFGVTGGAVLAAFQLVRARVDPIATV